MNKVEKVLKVLFVQLLMFYSSNYKEKGVESFLCLNISNFPLNLHVSIPPSTFDLKHLSLSYLNILNL